MYVATRLVKFRAGVTIPLTRNLSRIHPHHISAPDSAEKTPNSACMLTRRLSQSHTIRTTRLVLPHLQRFYTSALSQRNKNLKAPPKLTLDWEGRNQDFGYRCDDCDDCEINVSTLRDFRHQKIKVDINPILDWSPRQPRISDNDITYQPSPIIDKNPQLQWLTATKSVLEPQLDWLSELSRGLGGQLEKAGRLAVRRLKSQDSGSRYHGLVRHSIEKGPGAEGRRFVRRVEGKSWDLSKKWLNPEAKTAEVQQAKLSEEEKLKREIVELQKDQEELESERGAPVIRQVHGWLDKIEAGRNITDLQEAIREGLGIQLGALADEQEESVVRRVGRTRTTLGSEQEQSIIGQVQSSSKAIGEERERLADEQEEPITTRVHGVRATPENEQQASKNGRKKSIVRQVQTTRNSEQESSPGAQGLIRRTLEGQHKPLTTVAKVGLVKSSTHVRMESRVRDISFEPQRTMEDQPTLTVEESDRRAIPQESDTAVTEKKTHNLKRTKISPESSLGSYQKGRLESGKKRKLPKQAKDGSPDTALDYDIEHLLSSLNILQEEDKSSPELAEVGSEIGLTISELSSTGEGLAVHKNRVYVVPFCVPGDKVNATIRQHNLKHSVAKVTSVVMPSSNRDDSLVGCKYFGTCAGCQLQMLPYAVQLEHKRKVIQKAFKNFSNLPPELLPEVGETMASPLQYGYRTKLTPHFNGPRRGGFKPGMPIPNIGFMAKDPKFNIDIEDCPIGTDAVRRGMKERRVFVAENLVAAFKRGATLLLRESTIRTCLEDSARTGLEGQLEGHGKKYTEEKVCITDSNAKSIEYVGDLKFESPAGSFFQNNNSILSKFTSYIRENLNLPVVKKTEGPDEATETTERPKYLVDAYCGSGLFSVTCGQDLERVWGIDVDKASIAAARRNALENNIQNASFMDSPAEDIFGKLQFPGSETSLIIDPPKRGCDKRFLDQLLDFAPKRVVYVSCNVHTQARDIGYVLADEKGKGYKIDSIKGCDFFPQTHHVESIVVMTRSD